jgi:hypothetical protein
LITQTATLTVLPGQPSHGWVGSATGSYLPYGLLSNWDYPTGWVGSGPLHAASALFELTGQGTVGPFGDVDISGSFTHPVFFSVWVAGTLHDLYPSNYGDLTLTNQFGSATLTLSGGDGDAPFPQPDGTTWFSDVHFTLESGTGMYAGWQASGTLDLHFGVPTPLSTLSAPHGDFDVTFNETGPAFTSGTTASYRIGVAGPIYTAAVSHPDGETQLYSLTNNPNNALAIDANTGAVTVAHPNLLSPGVYTFEVAAGSIEGVITQTVTLTVLPSQPPHGWVGSGTGTDVLDGAESFELTGHGTVGPFGDVDIAGSFTHPIVVQNYSIVFGATRFVPDPPMYGELTLTNQFGSATLKLSDGNVVYPGTSFSDVHFTLVSGTGIYAGWQASGTLDLHFGLQTGPSTVFTFEGSFDITFHETGLSFTSGTTASYGIGATGPIYTAAASHPSEPGSHRFAVAGKKTTVSAARRLRASAADAARRHALAGARRRAFRLARPRHSVRAAHAQDVSLQRFLRRHLGLDRRHDVRRRRLGRSSRRLRRILLLAVHHEFHHRGR